MAEKEENRKDGGRDKPSRPQISFRCQQELLDEFQELLKSSGSSTQADFLSGLLAKERERRLREGHPIHAFDFEALDAVLASLRRKYLELADSTDLLVKQARSESRRAVETLEEQSAKKDEEIEALRREQAEVRRAMGAARAAMARVEEVEAENASLASRLEAERASSEEKARALEDKGKQLLTAFSALDAARQDAAKVREKAAEARLELASERARANGLERAAKETQRAMEDLRASVRDARRRAEAAEARLGAPSGADTQGA